MQNETVTRTGRPDGPSEPTKYNKASKLLFHSWTSLLSNHCVSKFFIELKQGYLGTFGVVNLN